MMIRKASVLFLIFILFSCSCFAEILYIPVDLRDYCNVSKADECAGDKKGGWTDQGPGNDLSMLPTGRQVFNGIPFDIINPEENDNKSCIVLHIPGYVEEFVKGIKVQQANVKKIHFLHTSAYNGNVGDSGKYVINYRYQGEEYEKRLRDVNLGYVSETSLYYHVEIPIDSPRNMRDFWYCKNDLPEAKLAWRGRLASGTEIGILNYTWKNNKPAEFVESIDFYGPAKSNVVPILLAITLEVEKRDFAVSKSQQDKYYEILNNVDTVKNKCADLFAGIKNEIMLTSDISLKKRMEAFLAKVQNVVSDLQQKMKKLEGSVESLRSEAEIDSEINFDNSLAMSLKMLDQLAKKAKTIQEEKQTIYITTTKKNNQFANDLCLKVEKQLKEKKGYHARVSEIFLDASKIYLKDTPSDSYKSYLNSKNAIYWSQKAFERVSKADSKELDIPALLSNSVGIDSFDDMIRSRICINGKWEICKGTGNKYPVDGWLNISVPHASWTNGRGHRTEFATVKELNGIDWNDDEHGAWYRTSFDIPEINDSEKVEIEFKRVWMYSEVYVNGQYCGNNIGGTHRFFIDITDSVKSGTGNSLVVYVEDTSLTEREDKTNFACVGANGSSQQGGIYDDVFVHIKNSMSVETPFIQTSYRDKSVKLSCEIRDLKDGSSVVATVRDESGYVKSLGKMVCCSGNLFTLISKWEDAVLWGPSEPWGKPGALYEAVFDLYNSDGKLCDKLVVPFGFREFYIEGDKFYLNGKEIFLQGDHIDTVSNGGMSFRNPAYAVHYMNVCRGANIDFLRTHCMDAPDWWWDIADQLGMMFESHNHILAGYWGLIPDKNWSDPVLKKYISRHLEKSIKEFRNHPSIIMWVPENETFTSRKESSIWADAIRFWKEMDIFMKGIDPTRPIHHHGTQGLYAENDFPFEISSPHYPQDSDAEKRKELTPGLPTLFGEFQDLDLTRKKHQSRRDPVLYQAALDENSNYLTKKISLCKKTGVAGVAPYQIITWVALDSAEMYGMAQDDYAIDWPSYSGIGVKTNIMQSPVICWHSNNMPLVHRNSLYDDLSKVYEHRDPLNQKRPLEVCVVGANPYEIVYAKKAGEIIQVGVKSDANGRALFLLPSSGEYMFSTSCKECVRKLNKKPYEEVGGFEYLVNVNLN